MKRKLRRNNCSQGILVPRSSDPFGQHQESRPLASPNIRSPRFTDSSVVSSDQSDWQKIIASIFCACSRIGTPEVSILAADQKDRGLWGRECSQGTQIMTKELMKCRSKLLSAVTTCNAVITIDVFLGRSIFQFHHVFVTKDGAIRYHEVSYPHNLVIYRRFKKKPVVKDCP